MPVTMPRVPSAPITRSSRSPEASQAARGGESPPNAGVAGWNRDQPPLDAGHDAEGPLRADHEVEQVAGSEPGVEGVAGGILPGPREAGEDQLPRGAERGLGLPLEPFHRGG